MWLNIDCLGCIASTSITTYRQLLALRRFALRTLNEQPRWQKQFTIIEYDVWRGRCRLEWVYTLNYITHRIDGPAMRYNDGEYWYINGKLHRTDGPAIVFSNGSREWYLNGIRHRIGGPAIECSPYLVNNVIVYGRMEWLVNGISHREDGPASVFNEINGIIIVSRWYINGKLHRVDGPAVEYGNGMIKWFLHGQLHRTDGPAIVKRNGTEHWYMHGKRHRSDGPAVMYADGCAAWWDHGKRHNAEGPAIIRPMANSNATTKLWFTHGKLMKEELASGDSVKYHDDTVCSRMDDCEYCD